MLVIRLQRTGRKNLATYRIVAAEKARPVKGKFIEILGHYLPAHKTPEIKVDQERATFWMSKGAIPSDTVARILRKQGMKGMDKYTTTYTKKKSKNASEEPAAAPTPAPAAAAPAADAPVVEAPAADTPAPVEATPAPAESAPVVAEVSPTDDNAEKKE